MEDELAGTWISPQGTKVTVTREESGLWRSAVFFTRRGKTPLGEKPHMTEEEAREAIGKLEAQGYVRVRPGEAGPPPAASQTAGLALLVVGGILLVLWLVIRAA